MEAVEQVFGITLPLAETAPIRTVGSFYELVLSKVSGQKLEDGCLRSLTFYRLRRALMVACGVPRAMTTLNAKLSDLLPANSRRTQWSKLGRELGLALPILEYPSWFGFLLSYGPFPSFIIATPLCFSWGHPFWAISSFLVGVFLIAAGIACPSNPKARCIPVAYLTVRQAVNRIMSWNFSKLAQHDCRWNDREVYDALCVIIGDCCLEDPVKITPETKFANIPGLE